MPQQRRSLESREPRITSAQAKSFVKGAVKVGGYAKSGIEFGTTYVLYCPLRIWISVLELFICFL